MLVCHSCSSLVLRPSPRKQAQAYEEVFQVSLVSSTATKFKRLRGEGDVWFRQALVPSLSQIRLWPHLTLLILLSLLSTRSGFAEWRVFTAGDQRQARPPKNPTGGTAIKPGDRWPTDQKFRWLIGDLEIPGTIGKEFRGRRLTKI